MAAMKDMDECAADVKPEFDATACCMTCRPAPACTTKCTKDAFAALPVCEDKVKPKISGESCCPSCKPNFQARPSGDAGKKCTRDRLKLECEGDDVPDCKGLSDAFQKGARDGECCGVCKRPQNKCKLADIAKEMKDLPACADGVKPEMIEGECTPTCKPTRPKCDTPCDDTKICVRGGMCKTAKRKKYKLAFKKAIVEANGECEVIKEVVSRFCAKFDEESNKLCARVDDFLLEFKCAATDAAEEPSDDAEYVNRDVAVDEAEADRKRRFLLREPVKKDGPVKAKVQDLVEKALDDPDAGDEVKVVRQKVGFVKDKCSMEMRKACVASKKDLELCPADTKPAFIVETCCVDCKPAERSCQKCSDREAIGECGIDDKPMIDKTTCCPTCVKPKKSRTADEKKTKCSKEDQKECFLNLPVCETKEDIKSAVKQLKKDKDAGTCCGGCKRPETACKRVEVAKAKASLPVCEEGEKPLYVEGACGPSCKKGKPTCDTPCGDKQVCTKKGCKGKKMKKLKMRVRKELAEDGKEVTKEAVRELLIEVITDYCSKFDEKSAKLCERFEDIDDALTTGDVTTTTDGDDNVIVETEVSYSDEPFAEDDTETVTTPAGDDRRRRLNADDAAGDLITEAVNSSDEVTPLEVTEDTTAAPGSGNTTSSATEAPAGSGAYGLVASGAVAALSAIFALC